MIHIKLPSFLAKFVLWITSYCNDNHVVLVVKGYNEDYENYTALYWSDDKDLDFMSDDYKDFQLWIKTKTYEHS